jgi:hypothetical protein
VALPLAEPALLEPLRRTREVHAEARPSSAHRDEDVEQVRLAAEQLAENGVAGASDGPELGLEVRDDAADVGQLCNARERSPAHIVDERNRKRLRVLPSTRPVTMVRRSSLSAEPAAPTTSPRGPGPPGRLPEIEGHDGAVPVRPERRHEARE